MTSQTADLTTIELTLIESPDPLTKTYGITVEGLPAVIKHPYLYRGTATRLLVPTQSFTTDFAALLATVSTGQCIVLGAISDEIAGDSADITTKERHRPREAGTGSPLVWRGKDWFGYRCGRPAVVGLDHDPKGIPIELRCRVDAAGGWVEVLHGVCPAISAAACVSRPSSSTGVRVVETGKTTEGGGEHRYITVLDGGDSTNFVDLLHYRLILSGWGYPFVTDAGSIQIRSLVDTAASGIGERLWFEASAVLEDGLEHVFGARKPAPITGGMLDTKVALKPLTADEEVRLRQICVELRASVADEAAAKRKSHVGRIRQRIAQTGGDSGSADELVHDLLDAEERGILHGRHLLHLDDGRIVSVLEVMANRAAFHKVTCADPLEPEYGGGCNKAILYTDGRHPRLFTHAHGGRLFTLALDEVDVANAVNAADREGLDTTMIVKSLAPDALFAAGGWSQVENSTRWRVAEAPEMAAFGTCPKPAFRGHLTQLETGGDLVPLNHGKSQSLPLLLDDDPCIDLMLREFNSRFAVVAEGGSASVVRMAYNADLRRHYPVSMTLDAFKLLYGNCYVEVPSTKRKSGTETISAANLWLGHPARRSCPDGFAIDPTNNLPPTVFNLWQGFGVEEKRGNWSKLLEMIYYDLAAGSDEHFEYIITWLAHLTQFPHESPGVAMVFRGEEGTGKGTLGRALMRLMGAHAMQITHPKHLTGAFNAHMRLALFLFADEAFFAGDRASEGPLKGIITEDYRINEGKGRDATLGRNRLHLMMSSNNEWVVPAGANARRFAVFDVSSGHRQDLEYFGAINAEMDLDGEAAGIAAMLYDLKRIRFDPELVRTAPETAGLHAQRINSLRGIPRWLFDVLLRGYVSEPTDPWQEVASTEDLHESYVRWSVQTKEAYPGDRIALGTFLSKLFKGTRPRVNGARFPGYRLGKLQDARRIFATTQGIGDPWPQHEDE